MAGEKYRVEFVSGQGGSLAEKQTALIAKLDGEGYEWHGFASTSEQGTTSGVLLYFKKREVAEQVMSSLARGSMGETRKVRRARQFGRI